MSGNILQAEKREGGWYISDTCVIFQVGDESRIRLTAMVGLTLHRKKEMSLGSFRIRQKNKNNNLKIASFNFDFVRAVGVE